MCTNPQILGPLSQSIEQNCNIPKNRESKLNTSPKTKVPSDGGFCLPQTQHIPWGLRTPLGKPLLSPRSMCWMGHPLPPGGPCPRWPHLTRRPCLGLLPITPSTFSLSHAPPPWISPSLLWPQSPVLALFLPSLFQVQSSSLRLGPEPLGSWVPVGPMATRTGVTPKEHESPHQKSPGWKHFLTWHYNMSRCKKSLPRSSEVGVLNAECNPEPYCSPPDISKIATNKSCYLRVPYWWHLNLLAALLREGHRPKAVWIGTVSKLEFYLAPFGLNLDSWAPGFTQTGITQ